VGKGERVLREEVYRFAFETCVAALQRGVSVFTDEVFGGNKTIFGGKSNFDFLAKFAI